MTDVDAQLADVPANALVRLVVEWFTFQQGEPAWRSTLRVLSMLMTFPIWFAIAFKDVLE